MLTDLVKSCYAFSGFSLFRVHPYKLLFLTLLNSLKVVTTLYIALHTSILIFKTFNIRNTALYNPQQTRKSVRAA